MSEQVRVLKPNEAGAALPPKPGPSGRAKARIAPLRFTLGPGARGLVPSLPVHPKAGFAGWRADLLAMIAYATTTTVFLWPIVTQGMVPFDFDLLTIFYPYKWYLSEVVRQGELPLWNPMMFMGAPLLGNMQVGALYPPDVLFYFLPTADALRYSVALHIFLPAAFTYLFARISLGVSPGGSWLAGAIFGFGGFVGARVGHFNLHHSAVWLPLLLLCLERAATLRSPRTAALGALALATQFLAGHPQEVYYSAGVLGLFALYLALFGSPGARPATEPQRRSKHQDTKTPRSILGAEKTLCLGALVVTSRERLGPFAMLAGMGMGAAAVSGLQLLPALELARESYRVGGIPLHEAANFSVRPRELLNSLLPLYWWTPYLEIAGYTSIISLLLLPAALAWRRRPPTQWFFAALGLLALMLSMGDSTPVYGWAYRLVPGFDLFRAPGRWLFVYGLSVALVAGIGVDSLRARLGGDDLRGWLGRYGLVLGATVAALVALRLWLAVQDLDLALPHSGVLLTWGILAAAGLAALTMAIAWPRSPLAVGLLAGLLFFDMYLAKGPLEYNKPTDLSLYTSPRPLFSRLDGVPPWRILSLAGEQYELPDEARLRTLLPSSMSKPQVDGYLEFTRLKEIAAANVGMVFGLRSLDGYDGGMLPTRRYAEFKHALLGSREYRPHLTMRAEATAAVPDSGALGALGVRYLLLNRGLAGYDSGWLEMEGFGDDPVRVLRNRDALPRAYLVHSSRSISEEKQLLEAVRSTDLSQVVLLSEEVEQPRSSQPGSDEVVLARDGANEVVVEVSSENAGFLVLADSYYPGWKVYVDGQEERLLRANYAMRAVAVPSGRHEVRFSYEPLSVRIGAALSLLGLGSVLAVLFWGRAR